MKFKTLLYTMGLVIFSSSLFAQNHSQLIQDYLKRHASSEKLQQDDINALMLSSQHYSKSLDAELVYMQQSVNDVPIFNAMGHFVVKNQKVDLQNHRFYTDIQQKTTSTSAQLGATEALDKAVAHFGLEKKSATQILEKRSKHNFVLENKSISNENIPATLVYQAIEDQLILAWDMSIYLKNTEHWWSFRIDATTGKIIDQNDWLLSCNFEGHNHENFASQTKTPISQQKKSVLLQEITADDEAQYRAYATTIESPNHGERTLLVNPADPVASPFGWHDTDGVAGAEYTITRGNNAYAQEDRTGNDLPGYSPDGGENLNFDFPIQDNQPAILNEDAAITNLFVRNNVMHDLWHYYGFDEDAGNFQEKNYEGSETYGNDPVYADAQDGSGVNNANFGTPPDGISPRMQMFLWATTGDPLPQITITTSSATGEYAGLESSFGPDLSADALEAELILATDTQDSSNACDPLTNTSDLDGQIAVITRGDCPFVDKVSAAEDAGAIAVIVINNEPGEPIIMGGDSATITIPSLMISQADGAIILSALEAEETLTTSLANNGPYKIDGDFDNGIIAHEYGHGISTRLTGGKMNVNCMYNDEQMGEGWSDWIGLVMTMKEGDQATDARGYGTYAVNQDITGNGIRPYRYTTDMTLNPATYDLTNNYQLAAPHGIGFVWATMLWDLTWEFVDEYGFDTDLYNGDGGNNKVMQLVIDGLKIQACEPGFIDGRDAILQADKFLNDGANQCLIWEVFARRGLGYSADQGSSNNRYDQTEAFDMPPAEDLNCALGNKDFDTDGFKIYPNPTENHFKIDFGALPLDKVNVQIFDLNGRVMLNENSTPNDIINVSHFSTGVYLVKMKNGSKTSTEKLIVK